MDSFRGRLFGYVIQFHFMFLEYECGPDYEALRTAF
jgi:hypothetical protein